MEPFIRGVNFSNNKDVNLVAIFRVIIRIFLYVVAFLSGAQTIIMSFLYFIDSGKQTQDYVERIIVFTALTIATFVIGTLLTGIKKYGDEDQ